MRLKPNFRKLPETFRISRRRWSKIFFSRRAQQLQQDWPQRLRPYLISLAREVQSVGRQPGQEEAAIVGEFVGAQSGLGMLLMQYNQSLQIASVFAVLLILALIGYLSNLAIRSIERKLCFWAQRATPVANSES